MAHAVEHYASKVPEVTLGFWVIKILATTLGETGGDTVTMTMDLGYLTGTAIFLSVLVVLVVVQIAAKKFHPLLYWSVIVASTTAGTTLADFATRSLGIGYMGGSLLLFGCLMAVLALWYWSEGSVSVATVNAPKAEAFYWAAITFSPDLGDRARRIHPRPCETGRGEPTPMPYFAPSSFLAIAVSRNSTKEVTWPCSTSTELRDFGGGLVLGFRMAHAGSPADGSLVAIDEQVENGEVAQREIGDHGVRTTP